VTTQAPLDWLDDALAGYSVIQNNGSPLPQRSNANIVGAFAIADDEANDATVITLGTGSAAVVIVVSAGTVSATPGMSIYMNLDAIGGNVTIQPGAIPAGQNFSVKLIGPQVGGHTCTILPISGGQIELDTTPGTLGSQCVLSAPGQRVTMESKDGQNLYY
jgi:hypothetical protein